MSKLIIPKTTTAYRETAVPKAADLLFDTDINKMVIGDGVTPGGIVINASGGTASSEVTGGFGINVVDNEVSLKRYDSISTLINGGTVQAGYAYKLNATSSSGTTIYAEWFEKGTFARDPAHIQIMVNGVGYLHLGRKTTAGSETAPFVLVGALEPDAMNNVTVRFHDGVAVMTVEDHIGGYVVISGGTSQSTAGTLPYALVNTGEDASPYITFSSELNGTTFDVTGVTVTTERHVVGNGYDETKITGDVNVGTSGTLTMAAVGLQNVTVVGGTMTFGDAYIPSGATVAVSGGGLVVEKVTGNGGVISMEGRTVAIYPTGSFISGVTLTGFYIANNTANGIITVNGWSASGTLVDCVITGNTAGRYGGVIISRGSLTMSNCIVSGNIQTSTYPASVLCNADGILNIIGGTYSDPIRLGSATNIGKTSLSGQTKIESIITDMYGQTAGILTITSGAIVDLTGNTNATPIAPGGGITFEEGGATVLYSSGAVSGSYMMDNVTLPAGAKLTNTAVVDLGGTSIVVGAGATANVMGCTTTNGVNVEYGAFLCSATGASLNLTSCTVTGNTVTSAGYYGGGISLVCYYSAAQNNVHLSGCIVSGNANDRDVSVTYGNNSGGIHLDGGNTIGNIGASMSGRVFIGGSNSIGSIYKVGGTGGTVLISSGAILDLTGNTNTTPVAPGVGVVVDGGCTVITSAGASVSIAGGTYTKINNDGTTE